MTGQDPLTRDVDIDVAGLFRILGRKLWLVTAITLLTALGLFLFLSTVSPRYEASTRVLIENRESVFTRNDTRDQGLSQSQFDKEAIGSQVQVMNSDTIVLDVIKSLGLAKVDEFRDEENPLVVYIKQLLGQRERVIDGVSAEQKVLGKFREHLNIYPVSDSRVIVVEFWSRDPEIAKNVPNAIANAFIELQKEAELDVTTDATAWLGPEIDTLRERVRKAEAKVAEFRSTSDILDGNNNALLSTQQLSEVSSELSRLRAERASAEAKVASIRAAIDSGSSLDVIPEVIASPLIQRLRESEVALRAEISELSTTLLPNHPRLKALQSQLGNFDRQIREAANNILRSLENNVDFSRKQETELIAEVNRLKAEASRVGEAEVELRALEREAQTERERLRDYQRSFQEAASRKERSYLPVNARIISFANLPSKPYFPKIIPFSMVGALVAAILSIIAIMAHALLTGRAFRPVGEMVVPGAPQPVHAEPPHAVAPTVAAPPLATAMPTAGASYGASVAPAPSQNVKSFPLSLALHALASEGAGRIAVVSPGGDEKPGVALDTTRILAATGKSVALVDLSSSGAASAKALGRNDLSGVREVLSGSLPFKNAVYVDTRSSAHVMPAGINEPTDPEQALGRLLVLAQALGEQYDFVVIDCGYSTAAGIARIAEGGHSVLIDAENVDAGTISALESGLVQSGISDFVVVANDTVENQPLQAA